MFVACDTTTIIRCVRVSIDFPKSPFGVGNPTTGGHIINLKLDNREIDKSRVDRKMKGVQLTFLPVRNLTRRNQHLEPCACDRRVKGENAFVTQNFYPNFTLAYVSSPVQKSTL